MLIFYEELNANSHTDGHVLVVVEVNEMALIVNARVIQEEACLFAFSHSADIYLHCGGFCGSCNVCVWPSLRGECVKKCYLKLLHTSQHFQPL